MVDTQDKQLEILIAPRRNPQPVSDEVIFLQPNKLAAIRLAIAVSGLDEKEVYMSMQIDKAQWSRIMAGLSNWPTEGDEQFEQVVANNVLTKWQANKRGYRLVPLIDAKDALIAKQETTIADQAKTIELLKDLVKR